MFACGFLTKKSRLDCFLAALSLSASCSRMVLLDLLPCLDSGSGSSLEFSETSSDVALVLDRVHVPPLLAEESGLASV